MWPHGPPLGTMGPPVFSASPAPTAFVRNGQKNFRFKISSSSWFKTT